MEPLNFYESWRIGDDRLPKACMLNFISEKSPIVKVWGNTEASCFPAAGTGPATVESGLSRIVLVEDRKAANLREMTLASN